MQQVDRKETHAVELQQEWIAEMRLSDWAQCHRYSNSLPTQWGKVAARISTMSCYVRGHPNRLGERQNVFGGAPRPDDIVAAELHAFGLWGRSEIDNS